MRNHFHLKSSRILTILAIALVFAVGCDDDTVTDPVVETNLTAWFECPNLSALGPKNLPATIHPEFSGQDVAANTDPAKFRHLIVLAEANGTPIRTPTEYLAEGMDLIDWDSPDWSAWADYPSDPDDRVFDVTDLTDGSYYFVALQMMDSSGGVSIGKNYNVEVMHVKVLEGFFAPVVLVSEPELGTLSMTNATFEVGSGDDIDFSWTADASPFCGLITASRHGWDLVSADDENDPGWEVAAGDEAENWFSPTKSFTSGTHKLTIRVWDDSTEGRTSNRTIIVK